MTITQADVTACYRALLGRDPESVDVIARHVGGGASLEQFLHAITNSPEFVVRMDQASKQNRSRQFSKPTDVEVKGTAAQAAQLVKHTDTVWSAYGEADPYYSVMTNERYRKDVIGDAEVEEFYQTGADSYAYILNALARNGKTLPKTGTVLDLGCGLGRVGVHFAKNFKNYIGVDISKPHLQQAELRFKSLNLHNGSFVLLKDFMAMKSVADFIFCVIVLQHNPPPVIGMLIAQMCSALKPGGVMFFQVPTALVNYRFVISEYLSNLPSNGIMEMHAFPQKEIFRILAENKCIPVEVFERDMIGPIGESTVVIAQRVA